MMPDYYIFSSEGSRECNEDRADMRSTDNAALFIVADGLGGHRYGEIAADCAVEGVISCFLQDDVPEDKPAMLMRALTDANERILDAQRTKAARMKSTAVVLYLGDDATFWAHIGDSRLYRIHDDELCFITEDHSVAYKKYKAGEITRDGIATDEDQSSLLRVLGTPGEIRPDFGSAPLAPGDAFLLCSDGVWEYVRDHEVLIDYHKATSAREWAELMLLRLMERIPDDNDNLSLITVMT